MAENNPKSSKKSTPSKEEKYDQASSSDGSSSDSDSSLISTISKDTKSDYSVKSSVKSRSTSRKEKLCQRRRSCCGACLCVCKVAIVLSIFLVLSLIGVGFLLTKLEFHCKLDKLGPKLYSELYGQDVAIKRTLDSVTNFCTSFTSSNPLTLVFWGPTGVGKTSFATSFTDHFDSKGQVIPSEHFKAAKYKDWYGSHDHSKPFVFAVDDVMTLEDMQNIATNVEKLSFPVILIITTSMDSNLLNQSFIEWSTSGKAETDFVYTGEDPKWLGELEYLNPVIVPFLPLSRTNVKLCIEKTLKSLKMKYKRDDIEKIANEYEYFHNEKRLFAKIGCKRVNDKIFSVLSP